MFVIILIVHELLLLWLVDVAFHASIMVPIVSFVLIIIFVKKTTDIRSCDDFFMMYPVKGTEQHLSLYITDLQDNRMHAAVDYVVHSLGL